LNDEKKIIEDLCQDWGIEKSKIKQTATRFFKDFKYYSGKCTEQDKKLLNFQIQLLLFNSNWKFGFVKSDQEDIGLYIANLRNYYEDLVEAKKGIIFYNHDFVFGFIGNKEINKELFVKHLEENKEEHHVEMKEKEIKHVETKEEKKEEKKKVEKTGKQDEKKDEKKEKEAKEAKEKMKVEIKNEFNDQGLFVKAIQRINCAKFEEFVKGLGFVNVEEAGSKDKSKGKDKKKGKK